ncbi:putative stem-specific protein TSJT1 [Helianthus annuus]|nr:putative stem-specific protein TSJT1 [Helianthus annuus]
MILSGIIRVNGSGIGRVSLNLIPVGIPGFFLFLSPYPAYTHWASGIPGPYVSGFGYTRWAWAFLPYVANYAHTLYCSVDDVHCIFLGCLNNVCALNKQYGLAKGTNESMFVIQAYKTLRDRGPFGPQGP